MIVYKFKSLQNITHVFDIIENRRFFAANFLQLNDPMEGFFYAAPYMQNLSERIRDEKGKLNICSFSRDFCNPLLWAHYADNFRGVCFEIEIDESPAGPKLFDVHYVEGFPSLVSFRQNISTNPSFEIAKEILSHKIKNWEYEREVRILTREAYIDSGITIKSIFLGLRVSKNIKWLFRRLDLEGVDIFITRIEGSKIAKSSNVKRLNLLRHSVTTANHGENYEST